MLVVALPVSGQTVEWTLSNEWQDVSCDTVCQLQGHQCVEECWPASVLGLKAALNAPQLSGVCFQVTEGPAASWHPAKDADNTFCYWNPGVPTQARCPVVPQTPPEDAQQGRWTRRLCPCVNQTAAFVGDCGLGSQPAALLPGAVGSAQAPSATTIEPTIAHTSAPTPAPAQSIAVPYTCNLCISGFAGEDDNLNGRYVRSGTSWRLGDVMLVKGANGHWQFQERQLDGNYIPISQGSLLPEGSSVPPSDSFSTSTGDWTVAFSSCCDIQGSETHSALDRPTNDDTTGMNPAAAVGLVIGSFVAVGLIVVLLARVYYKGKPLTQLASVCYKWKPQKQCHKPKVCSCGALFEPGSSFCASCGARRPEEDDIKPMPINLPRFTTTPDLFDAELGAAGHAGNAASAEAHVLRAVAGKAAAAAAPPVPPVPRGLQDSHVHGIYEGPVERWWEEGSRAVSASPGSFTWQVGDQVRLCGLGPKSTLNGALGVVELHSQGLVHVRLPDGRLKTIRQENCESPTTPPRLTGGWRGRMDGSSGAAANPSWPPPMTDGSGTGFGSSSPSNLSRTADAISLKGPDAGAGVTSWLATTPTTKQVGSPRSPVIAGGTGNFSDSWARLPNRSSPGSMSPPAAPSVMQQTSRSSWNERQPIPQERQRPTSELVGRRSASSGPRQAFPESHGEPAAARRSASSGTSARRVAHGLVDPAGTAMSLTPCKPGASSKESAPRHGQAHPAIHGLQDDLMQAQKRTEAKLAALKTQLSKPSVY